MSEARELFSDNATKERQKSYADDRKRRFGLRSILPDAWFYSVVEHRGIWIRGSEEFIALSSNALELLAKISEWNIIGDNIRSIKQSLKSSTHVRTGGKRKGVIVVSWPVWRTSSPETYAGMIAHEAFHNQTSREPEANINAPTFREEERMCTDFEIRLLEKLGNAEHDIRGLRMLTRFPTHFGSYDNLFDLIWRMRRN